MRYILKRDAIIIERDIKVFNKYSFIIIHEIPRILTFGKKYIDCIIIGYF